MKYTINFCSSIFLLMKDFGGIRFIDVDISTQAIFQEIRETAVCLCYGNGDSYDNFKEDDTT